LSVPSVKSFAEKLPESLKILKYPREKTYLKENFTHKPKNTNMRRFLLLTCLSALLCTIVNAQFSLRFDGKNDYVQIPYSTTVTPTPAITVEAWVKVYDWNANPPNKFAGHSIYQYMIFKKNVNSNCSFNEGFLLKIVQNTRQFEAMMDDPGNCATSISQRKILTCEGFIEFNRWYHLALVADNNNIEFYVDGVKQCKYYPNDPNAVEPSCGSNTPCPSPSNFSYSTGFTQNYDPTTPVYFGTSGWAPGWDGLFYGEMDEVRISNVRRYSSNFTPQQYHNNDANTGALYHFDEGVGLSLGDVSGNNNNGTLSYYTGLPNGNAAGPTWVGSIFPVRWLSFTAKEKNKKIYLNWSTASEMNNTGFEVERSNDGVSYKKIGWVASKGNSNNVQQYEFTDAAPGKGTRFYRLKQIDIDNKYEYSSVKSVKAGSGGVVAIYPNPVKDELKLQLDEVEPGTQITITDQVGRTVLTRTISAPGIYKVNVQALARGLYMLSVTNRQKRVFDTKILKE
jgi:hypothetical protein